MQTPANSAQPAGLPFITPKFNTATPLHRIATRVPKPNEFAVSLNGSPICFNGTATKAAGRGKAKKDSEASTIPLKLADGRTLSIPANLLENRAPNDLDDNERRRLLELRAHLDNMLDIKSDK